MWQDLGAAIALLLVVEGIMPFVSPATLRRALTSMLEMNDRALRLAGLGSMALGVLLLYLIK
ncbi:MAG: DUF2065 domain-containing protein [Gammaproteobacteria bacterium]